MEAAPQAATNAKTVTNTPHPPNSPGTDHSEELQTPEQLPKSATAAKINNVMAKSVATAGSESPAVDGGGKVITNEAKAAAVAAAEALKSGNVTIARSHLNAAKLMSAKTNHPNLCLTEAEDDDIEKDGITPTPVPKGAALQQLSDYSPPMSNNVSDVPVDTTIDDDTILSSLISRPPNSIVIPPLAPSSNDEGLDDSHSGDEDRPDLIKLKPPRPPRKKVKETLKEPLYEEDIIEGFSFAAFKTYEDLEKMAKWSSQHNGKYPDPYSKLKFNDEKKKEKKKKKNKNRDREHNRENKILSQIDSNANKCDSDSEGDKESDRNRVGHGDLLKSRKVDNLCHENGLSESPFGANIPTLGYTGLALPPSDSQEAAGLSHFGSPLAASSPNAKSSFITNVASAPAARSAPTPKPKGFFRPYSTSPTPPKVSDSESQNVSSIVSNNGFNVPRQSPFSHHPAYRLPNTTTTHSGALIPHHPGVIHGGLNGSRPSYLPLDHHHRAAHHYYSSSAASSLSPFVPSSGYPEYSSVLNNNSPYYPNYPPRSLNGPTSSSSLPSTTSVTNSLGYPGSALLQPNLRPGPGLSAVSPYYPPPEVNGSLSSARTTVPCSTSTSTVPSHHQDLSCKSTHSLQPSLSHNSRPTSAPSSQLSSAKVAQSWPSPILSATPSPSSSIRSSFPSPSLGLTTPPGPGTPQSGVLPPPLPGLRLPAPGSAGSTGIPTNTVPPSPLASTLAPDPTAGVAPLGAASRADLLRRELDSQILARASGGLSGAPGGAAAGLLPQPFLHTEMHHHQHQHTHIHQHNSQSTSTAQTAGIPPSSATPSIGIPPTPGLAGSLLPPLPGAPSSLLPPPGASSFMPNHLLKDGKIGGANSMFYRAPGFPEFSSLGIPRPPDPLRNGNVQPPPTSFMPPVLSASLAPKKTGKWNAMHVRIAWEIYNLQQKQKSDSKEKSASSKDGSSASAASKSSSSNLVTHASTASTTTAGINPSSLSRPSSGGGKSSSSDILGRPPPGAADLPNSKPSAAELLRAGHGALFSPGLPRPPDPFGLIRPPYPGPSLFGPSHLESALSPFPRYGSSAVPFGGLGGIGGSLRGPTPIHPPLSGAMTPGAIKPDPFSLTRPPGFPSNVPSTVPPTAGVPPGWPTSLGGVKAEADIKKERQRKELEEKERREKQREREKRAHRSNEIRPPPTGRDGTLPQYLATQGIKDEPGRDHKREASRSPARSLPSGSPGARSNTSSVAPSDVRSVESASVSPLVKRETAVNELRPLSASNHSKGISVSANSELPTSHHGSSGILSRSTSANDLSAGVKKEEANEVTVIGEKEGLLNGRSSTNSMGERNHTGNKDHHHHSINIHNSSRKAESPSRHASSLPFPGGGGSKQDSSRGSLSNPSRDSSSVKPSMPSSVSQSTSLSNALSISRSSELLAIQQQQAVAVSIASSLMGSGVPYNSIPGLPPHPPPGYLHSDPRTAAALGMFPRPGAATPLPPGFGTPGMVPPGLDPFRDHYLAAAMMGAAPSNPYLKDPLREAREREMLRLNPLGSMIMTEHDRARMALGYPPGLFPPSHSAAASPTSAGFYGLSAAALAAGAAKIPPPLGASSAATIGAPHLGLYSNAAAAFPPPSALGALGAAGVPGLTPPLTPTVNGHGGPPSSAASPALSRDHHPLAR